MTDSERIAPARSEDAVSGTYFDLYKLTVEMADRVTARRGTANSFFLAVNSALAAVVGATSADQTVAALAGIVLSAAWWLLLRSYRDLNRAKFKVIIEMEQKLPVQPYDAEWKYLKDDKVAGWRGRYAEQGTVERVVPVAFIALYLAVILGAGA